MDQTHADCVVSGEADHVDLMTLDEGMYDVRVVEDLDSVSFPDRDLFDWYINDSGIHGSMKPSTTVITSRGCPFRCNFCCKGHEMYRRFRARSSDNVIEELEWLVCKGVRHVRFVDDCFTLNRDRVIDLCSELKRLPVTWIAITRSDCVDDVTLNAMREGGCVQIDLGVETGSPRLLREMNKRETVDQQAWAIKEAKKLGIKVKVFLMMGYPTEDEEDRSMTLEFLRYTKPDDFTLSVWQPLDGSYCSNGSSAGYFYPDGKQAWVSYRRQIREVVNGRG
jgi:radical SAM superfamily enzyme YgiQ (UPF0313 family)